MKSFTNKNILRVVILLIVVTVIVKYVPPINDVAREYLPTSVLELIGEQPKGLLEKGTDSVKDMIGKMK